MINSSGVVQIVCSNLMPRVYKRVSILPGHRQTVVSGRFIMMSVWVFVSKVDVSQVIGERLFASGMPFDRVWAMCDAKTKTASQHYGDAVFVKISYRQRHLPLMMNYIYRCANSITLSTAALMPSTSLPPADAK